MGGRELALRMPMERRSGTTTRDLIVELKTSMSDELPEGKVSSAEVKRVKGSTQRLTCAPLDKGGKQLRIECDVPHRDRVQKMVIECDDDGEDTREENVIVSFEQIMVAVDLDLAHNYCGVGTTILEQLNGCPIGRSLSEIYANIECENEGLDG